ncbi:phenoloxidase-activating factor 2-like [Bombyx mandarina]|uniref:Phenoloxidase-activating factor 2 n=2 Tax=Bombyx TaxID=7090 RepID=Q8I9N4_BOMMO|nr:clip domain serine protease 11 precursor [Bombyx mori]XP_028035703.1 phenoloxidase-activating factor 2-like [Bombyx mandarina]XP_028035704.1 phenoloxidase-activating factor 2-like [Bombyx mandarina]AAN77090.1 masquerade-like serine proteinase homolog [Bombyx mori]BAG70412.1 serine protease homolog 1 [Bombyx mori]
MYKLLLIGFLASACAQNMDTGDLESIINQIFTSAKPPTQLQPVTQPSVADRAPSTLVPGVSTNDDLSCQTSDGQEGECVNYYLCNAANNTIITDGTNVIDIRVGSGPCSSYIDVCCLAPDQRPPTDPITPRPETLPMNQGCGWRNPDGVAFRTTGDVDGETKFGEFPWMVAILKVEPVDDNEPEGQKLNVYVGGGSLIHPNVVLTAAHYVAAAKELKIRAGEWDTQNTKEIYPYQDRTVKEIVIHKDFNKGNLFYDIALLFLETPVDSAPNVGVACLPPARERAPAGVRCFATGWGKDKFGKEGRYQVIMKKVDVPVVDRNTCQSQLRRTRLGRFFQLHSTFMCAGGEPDKDTCRGDGGSPLVCPIDYEKNRYVQYGIVAWGIGCGEDGTPGVYVDVSNLRTWIDDKVAGKGYDTRSYEP